MNMQLTNNTLQRNAINRRRYRPADGAFQDSFLRDAAIADAKISHYSLPVTVCASDRTQADIGKSLPREVDIEKLLYALSDLSRKP